MHSAHLFTHAPNQWTHAVLDGAIIQPKLLLWSSYVKTHVKLILVSKSTNLDDRIGKFEAKWLVGVLIGQTHG